MSVFVVCLMLMSGRIDKTVNTLSLATGCRFHGSMAGWRFRRRLDAASGFRSLLIVAIMLATFCQTSRAWSAETAANKNGSSAVTAGSLRQRELLQAKDEEIKRLREALAKAEARIAGLPSPAPGTADAPQHSTPQSGNTTARPIDAADVEIIESEAIGLGQRWYVAVSATGPRNYIDLQSARRVQTLPDSDSCESFAMAFEQNDTLSDKLEVNGFPITSFWVLRSDGKLGVCRINRAPSGGYRASLATGSPSRSDKAIIPLLR